MAAATGYGIERLPLRRRSVHVHTPRGSLPLPVCRDAVAPGHPPSVAEHGTRSPSLASAQTRMRLASKRPDVQRVLDLQRDAGNRAVQQLVGPFAVQRSCDCGGTCARCSAADDQSSANDEVLSRLVVGVQRAPLDSGVGSTADRRRRDRRRQWADDEDTVPDDVAPTASRQRPRRRSSGATGRRRTARHSVAGSATTRPRMRHTSSAHCARMRPAEPRAPPQSRTSMPPAGGWRSPSAPLS